MSKEYTQIAGKLAQNLDGMWKIIADADLNQQGMKELIKSSIKPTQVLLKLAENYNVENVGFKNGILKQVQDDLEQEKNNRLLKML